MNLTKRALAEVRETESQQGEGRQRKQEGLNVIAGRNAGGFG